jgi:membrane-associated phospholipid phosphatase
MRLPAVLAICLALAAPVARADEASAADKAAHALANEVRRYAKDTKEMAGAPFHWTKHEWRRFGEGMAGVAVLYVADRKLYDAAQRNRSDATDHFADAVTPFGGRRAEYISLLMIAGGAWRGDTALRDAGRDSLEAEIIAGGIVTPALKRAFGRSRPIQEEGAHKFRPGSSTHESFPSGHATNAFAFATAVAGHYDGWVVPTVVYSLATAVAVSRVNDRAHFPSDVLAGALIGHAVAKGIVYRHRTARGMLTIAPAAAGRGAAFSIRWIER